MATYKNIDDLLEIIDDWQKTLLPIEAPEDKVVFTVLENVNDYIHDLDTADVMEVVRCLECVHCDPENRHCDHPMGTTLPIGRKETDFCSYGKKVE